MTQNKRRRRSQRVRRKARLYKAIGVAVLVLALVGLGTAVLMDRLAERTGMVYPMEYTELIRSRAAAEGLEPAYVAAVILAESSYNPQAVSSVNAQGLMQIMPETGAWIAGKFDETYVEGCLFDPETNIRYGCWYLGYLQRRYDGDKTCSTAAYHSGQGTVDGWLKDPAYSTDGRTLNIIGGPRANTYVGRVLEYYERYSQLYADLEA